MDNSFAGLQHPFIKLPKVSEDRLKWTVRFYHPKHSDGDRERLDRLESQVQIVIKLATSLLYRLDLAKNSCMRSKEAKDIIQRNLKTLIDWFKLPKYDTDEDEEEDSECALRISKLFLQKRHLLHIILFVHANEPEIAQPRLKALKLLEDLIEEDTTEWMEILDFVETMKNPNYLKEL